MPDPDCRWVWTIARRNPEVVFQRLLEHDALHLLARVPDCLARRYLLLDAERVFVRAAARIAYAAAIDDRPEPVRLDAWLEMRLHEATDDCLVADARALEDGLDAAEEVEHYAQFHWTFMVPEERTLAASVAFNSTPHLVRRSFFELLIERRSVEECLARGLGPPELLRQRVRRALDAATDNAPIEGLAQGRGTDEHTDPTRAARERSG